MVRKIIRTEGENNIKITTTNFSSSLTITRKLMIFLLTFIIILLTIQLITTFNYKTKIPQNFDFNYFNYYLKHAPITNQFPNELKTISRPEQTKTNMIESDKEWLNVMRNNKIIAIDFNMTKGYSNKYKVYLEGGYVAVAKPVMAIEETSTTLPVIDFYQGSDHKNKKNGERTSLIDRRLTQGWSEIAAFHLDRILKFYRKPPITGRLFDNHFFFAFNDSDENMRYRNMKTFDYPMALVGWMDHVHSLYPTYDNLGDILLMQSPINKTILSDIKSVSDTIVFDFLVDDHDKHNSQNWVGYVNKGEHFLLFWDSGLAWLHGPEGKDSCFDLLCGPKDWRDKIPGYNDSNCLPICRFNKKTVDNLRLFGENDFGYSLGSLLEESLRSDPLYPVFSYGIYNAKLKNETAPNPKGKTTTKVHFLPENFFYGMDVKVNRFLEHVDYCVEQFGADEVFLPSSKKI